MNTALLNTPFEKYSIPTKSTSPFKEHFPIIEELVDELDDDIHVFRVLDRSYMPASAPLPEKRHPVLDVDSMLVSASLLRRIEHELKHDECDLRTVFSSCRGLTRGSIEFEDAYIKARIRSFTRNQRMASDPLLDMQLDARNSVMNLRPHILQKELPATPHPMAVNHLGHLMSHLGIWVIALLGIQAWASWRIGAIANTYLEGGRMFYFAIALFLILTLDSAIWFRRRGNLCDSFLVPGSVLFLFSLLPIITLHLREIILSTH